jgi:arabinogalactan oligomer/maltooligosaccharide transport system substrate-binding protein
MRTSRLLFVSLLAIVSLLLAACQPTATPAAPAASPEATTAVEPTTAVTGALTLWHSYHTGGAEEQALTQVVDMARQQFPDAEISVLAIPFDQVFNKWETEVAAGSGPDMFIAPNDNLGKEVRAGLLEPVDASLLGEGLYPIAIEGMTVDGKLYAVPESLKAVALYYNSESIETPPTTTDELLQLVKDGKVLVLNQNPYHNFGFWSAFGEGFFAEDGTCDAGGGLTAAMEYLVELKEAGARFETDGSKADTMFRTGEADMIINGPWAFGDYRADVGDKLGVAPMPAGPAGPAGPLTGVDGWYVNPNGTNKESAVNLALFLTTQAAEQIYVDVAGHSPARTDVTIGDPLIAGFAESASNGYPRPQGTWFDNYWGPFGDQFTKIIEGTVEPAAGIEQACADMNAANGK